MSEAKLRAAVGKVGVIADGLSSTSRLSYLTVNAAAASLGQSSYGILVRNSGTALTIDNVVVNAAAVLPAALTRRLSPSEALRAE